MIQIIIFFITLLIPLILTKIPTLELQVNHHNKSSYTP